MEAIRKNIVFSGQITSYKELSYND